MIVLALLFFGLSGFVSVSPTLESTFNQDHDSWSPSTRAQSSSRRPKPNLDLTLQLLRVDILPW